MAVLGRFLALSLALAGCATVYEPLGPRGGFQEVQLDARTFRVSFQGHADARTDLVWNFWLYRCAELALQRGYDGFVVIEEVARLGDEPLRRHALSGAARAWPPPADRGESVGGLTPDGILRVGRGGLLSIVGMRSDAIVRLLREPYQEAGGPVIRARAVIDLLGPYVRSRGTRAVPSRGAILDAVRMSVS